MNKQILDLEVGDFEFTLSIQNVKGISVLNLDDKPGGYVFVPKYKLSLWLRIANWIDTKIFRNVDHFIPRQWIDISWFNGRKHLVKSYYFIPIGKSGGKSDQAPYVASLGTLNCFLEKQNPLKQMPDYVQVHHQSILGNKSFLYGKIQDQEYEGDIISSFVVCKAQNTKHQLCKGTTSIH